MIPEDSDHEDSDEFQSTLIIPCKAVLVSVAFLDDFHDGRKLRA